MINVLLETSSHHRPKPQHTKGAKMRIKTARGFSHFQSCTAFDQLEQNKERAQATAMVSQRSQSVNT
jgi:hypothetical protein